MKLRTEVCCYNPAHKISLDHKVLSIGSCFADHISNYLSSNKLYTIHNPFGNVYNPVSILNILNGSLGYNRELLRDKTFFKVRDELIVSLHFHSDINAPSEEELLSTIDRRLESTYQFIKSIDWMFITFGTAVGYKYIGNNDTLQLKNQDIKLSFQKDHITTNSAYNPYPNIIGNCHKLPASDFKKDFINLQQVTDLYNQFINSLRQLNPDVKIILSLSPVRYFQPSLIENSTSKAILRLLVDNIININKDIFYFPAHEILTDELRDYRYYNSDLVHPSDTAVEYILNEFANIYISPRYMLLINELAKIMKVINHHPFNPLSFGYQQLIEKTISSIEKSKFSEYLTKEKAILKRILKENYMMDK